MADLAGEVPIALTGIEQKAPSGFDLPPIEAPSHKPGEAQAADDKALQEQYMQMIRDAQAQQANETPAHDQIPAAVPQKTEHTAPSIELSSVVQKISAGITAPLKGIMNFLKSIGRWIAK
jgi:hypothetical protein